MPLTYSPVARGATLKRRNPYTGTTRTNYVVVNAKGAVVYHF